jgi:DNA-binding response OmpR family regulator
MRAQTGAIRHSPPGHAARSILVVECDLQLGTAIAEQLAADGYRADLARTAEHARVLARAGAPRLAVIGDLDPPRGALELVEEVRGSDGPWNEEMPIVVFSSRAHELDMLRVFEAGADDFLVRPARYLELRARLRAILRRTERATPRPPALRVGPLVIDQSARTASVRGQILGLRRLEYELLLHLAGDPERVFGKEELLRGVWGYRSSAATRTVDSHASRLRSKLTVTDDDRWVINVWGVGYRLI